MSYSFCVYVFVMFGCGVLGLGFLCSVLLRLTELVCYTHVFSCTCMCVVGGKGWFSIHFLSLLTHTHTGLQYTHARIPHFPRQITYWSHPHRAGESYTVHRMYMYMYVYVYVHCTCTCTCTFCNFYSPPQAKEPSCLN